MSYYPLCSEHVFSVIKLCALIYHPHTLRTLHTHTVHTHTHRGEKGYIRIARYGNTTKGEPCATDSKPGDGTGCKGGPASIQVCGLCGILSDSSYPTGGALVK